MLSFGWQRTHELINLSLSRAKKKAQAPSASGRLFLHPFGSISSLTSPDKPASSQEASTTETKPVPMASSLYSAVDEGGNLGAGRWPQSGNHGNSLVFRQHNYFPTQILKYAFWKGRFSNQLVYQGSIQDLKLVEGHILEKFIKLHTVIVQI